MADQVIIRRAGHQELDVLDATDLPDLSGVYDVAGAAAAAAAASQPVDSDLTAIAALTTTSYGRAFLALADAAAGRTALGLGTAAVAASGDFQPIDSDLTAIAALTTTAFGRALLALADPADATKFLNGTGAFSVPAGGSIDYAEAGDLSTQAFGDSPASGASDEIPRADHKHGMPAAPATVLGSGFFGDGNHGAITLQQSTAAPAWASKSGSGATTLFTLTQDLYATTLDFDDSAGNFLVRTSGFRIFASTSFVIDAGVTVQNDGNAAAAATQGAAVNIGAGATSSAGSAGAVNTTASQAGAQTGSGAVRVQAATAHGGAGGGVTAGTGNGVAGGTCALAAAVGSLANLGQALSGLRFNAVLSFTGGGGGTGGNATGGATATGGGGGGGAGPVWIYAKLLTNNGIIRAQGGAGGNGALGNGTAAGGGGGGGGGYIVLVYGSGSTTGTLTVTGGTGGALAGAGGTGGTGVSGLTYLLPL